MLSKDIVLTSLSDEFLLLFIPLGVVFYYSLQQNPHLDLSPEGLSFFNYFYFFTRPHYINVIFRTLWFAILTTIGSVVIGYGASMVLRRVMHRIGSTAVLLLAFPILSGPIVTVLGWMIMLTSNGLVGQSISIVRDILGLPAESTRLLGSDIAVIIGMIHFNLAFVILNLLNVMLKIKPELEEEGIRITKDFDPSIPELLIDNYLLEQAILNLVRNAKESLISFNTLSPKIDITTRILHQEFIGEIKHHTVCKISIEDNGPGIPEEIKESIFFPMISGKESGSGLGLSITQAIISQHKGAIEFHSSPGDTNFSILMPVDVMASSSKRLKVANG